MIVSSLAQKVASGCQWPIVSLVARSSKFLRQIVLYMSYDVFTYLFRVSDFSSSNFQYCLMGSSSGVTCTSHTCW
jgi:hypothetical protein